MGCINDKPERKEKRLLVKKATSVELIITDAQRQLQLLSDFKVFKPDYANAESNGQPLSVVSGSSHPALSLSRQFADYYEQCKHYFHEHDIDNANFYALKCRQLQGYHNFGSEQQKKYKLFIAQVQEQYSDVLTFSNQINLSNWVLKSNEKGISISTRRQNATANVLIESIVEQPFQNIISILIEMDLYKEFIPFMEVSRQEKIGARNCRIGYTENNFPILSIRQAFFVGIGYNRLKHNNTLFLYTRTIHNRKDLQQRLGYQCEINKNHSQLDYRYLALQYTPIAKGVGKMALVLSVNSQLNFIIWIQDKLSQQFGEGFFKNIIKLSRNFKNSQWEKNVAKNPELFNFFKNAIDTHLQEQAELEL